MDCELPGGAWADNHLVRQVRFRPITGTLEQEICQRFGADTPWPQVVSGILAAAVARVGDCDCPHEVIDNLTVADRNYLLLQLCQVLDGDEFWVTGQCSACQAHFDLGLRRSKLPIKPAGPGYPFAELECAGRRILLRVPTGVDQKYVLGADEAESIRVLAQRCVVQVDGAPPVDDFAWNLSEADLARIDDTLDQLSPDIGLRVQTDCPECNASQIVHIDPYQSLLAGRDDLYHEVHTLASQYHWSESDILSLPRERRHLYLRIIERTRGLFQ